FFSNSISVMLDGVNNLSDAFSSVITIVGTKLSEKPADRDHPMGHGRTEYLTASVISLIVLYAGVTSLVESVKKIFHPETPEYNITAIVILLLAVIVKISLGLYVRKTGISVHSDSLKAQGQDALQDAVISASTILAALIFIFFHISLEAYLGAVISIFIVKAGYEILCETISRILGERIDSDFSRDIRHAIQKLPGVYGVYDLVLHNYGPDKYLASVHIEVRDDMNAKEIDALTRIIDTLTYEQFGIVMTGVGIYARNTDPKTAELRDEISSYLMTRRNIRQVHGFFLREENKSIALDVVLDFCVTDRNKEVIDIQKDLEKEFQPYHFHVTGDYDISD
ncbi:MAG: cation transporter, partial [Lachnospiraceae bacterium]|nr:cation transporter [Lachnospiraceae bacterium]